MLVSGVTFLTVLAVKQLGPPLTWLSEEAKNGCLFLSH